MDSTVVRCATDWIFLYWPDPLRFLDGIRKRKPGGSACGPTARQTWYPHRSTRIFVAFAGIYLCQSVRIPLPSGRHIEIESTSKQNGYLPLWKYPLFLRIATMAILFLSLLLNCFYWLEIPFPCLLVNCQRFGWDFQYAIFVYMIERTPAVIKFVCLRSLWNSQSPTNNLIHWFPFECSRMKRNQCGGKVNVVNWVMGKRSISDWLYFIRDGQLGNAIIGKSSCPNCF